MIPKIRSLLRNPRRLVIVVAVGLLALVMLVVVCQMAGGDDEPVDTTPVSETPAMSVEDQVAATVAASIPTEEPTPTPDVPATLVVAVEETRTAKAEGASFSGSIFAPAAEAPMPETAPVESYDPYSGRDPFSAPVFTRADERFLQDLGPALWFSVRLHLELEAFLKSPPDQIINDAGKTVSQRASYDRDRLRRELGIMTQHWESVSPRVRDYGRHLEETVELVGQASENVQKMFTIAERGDSVDFDALSTEERREVEALYWSTKELLNNYDTRIQSYGCSVCGELYRARSGVY